MSSPLSPHSHESTTSSNEMEPESSQEYEEADRFLKRMEMEKKMQVLQQRLELASVKASHGWADKSITEIERSMSPPPRRRSFKSIPPIRVDPYSPQPTSPAAYEPPSPSRPWQLIDVLWQPLPPSSRTPPASPRKRSRPDTSARRASTSAAFLPDRMRKEKRSYSHSTTMQDVDAANALAFMHTDVPNTPPRHRSRSAHTPPRTIRAGPPEEDAGEEDRSAADLMMFLAHSPSPLRKAARSTIPASPGMARVLFGEERIGKSNLAMAPPISASDSERGFGDMLGR